MGLFILLLVAKLQDFYAERSAVWQWALGCALLSSLLSFKDGILAFAVNVIVYGLYLWAYFALLRRYTDNLLIWVIIYLCGALLPVFLPLMVTIFILK